MHPSCFGSSCLFELPIMEGQLTQAFFRILNKPQTYADTFQLIEKVKTHKHRRGEEDKEVPYSVFLFLANSCNLAKKFKKVKKKKMKIL
jgi:hypothetical protein